METLLGTMLPTFRNYPRHEHTGMCQIIKQKAFEGLFQLHLAEFTHGAARKDALKKTQATLVSLMTVHQLAYKEGYITEGFLENVCRDTEIILSGVVSQLTH